MIVRANAAGSPVVGLAFCGWRISIEQRERHVYAYI
jgi:hypothetical protein